MSDLLLLSDEQSAEFLPSEMLCNELVQEIWAGTQIQ